MPDPASRITKEGLSPQVSYHLPLRNAIRAVGRGKIYLAKDIKRLFKEDPPMPELSPRQREILDSITRGLTNQDIATQLGISLDMVKKHMTALLQKMNVANRSEAVAIALRKHLLKI